MLHRVAAAAASADLLTPSAAAAAVATMLGPPCDVTAGACSRIIMS
jgi:hypothetical protein